MRGMLRSNYTVEASKKKTGFITTITNVVVWPAGMNLIHSFTISGYLS